MLAVVTALRKFKTYLWGHPVLRQTDNAAVNYILHIKEPEGQLACWLEQVGCYNLQVTHHPGQSHDNADALSHHPCRQCGCIDKVGSENDLFSDNKQTGEMSPGRLSKEQQADMENKAQLQEETGQLLGNDTEELAEKYRKEQPCLAIIRQQKCKHNSIHLVNMKLFQAGKDWSCMIANFVTQRLD